MSGKPLGFASSFTAFLVLLGKVTVNKVYKYSYIFWWSSHWVLNLCVSLYLLIVLGWLHSMSLVHSWTYRTVWTTVGIDCPNSNPNKICNLHSSEAIAAIVRFLVCQKSAWTKSTWGYVSQVFAVLSKLMAVKWNNTIAKWLNISLAPCSFPKKCGKSLSWTFPL